MSRQQHKLGSNHARGMLLHGLVELRNAAFMQESNIAEDIRWSMPRGHEQQQGQEQAQQQEQRIER